MTLPSVIITRAQPGADETAARLREMGLSPIVSPVLSLELVSPVPDIPVEAAAGLVFTSANGVKFFAEVSEDRSLPAWCVGPATTAAAKATGFSTCFNANGNSRDLVDLIIKNSDPKNGRLVHIANTAASGFVQSELSEAGFESHFVGLYDPCLLYTSPSPRDATLSRMPSSA